MKIHFPNQRQTVEVPEKTRLSDVIREHFGSGFRMPCGGNGSCGKCRVRLGDGRSVLACQTLTEPEMNVLLDCRSCQSEILTCFSPTLLEGTEPDAELAIGNALALAFDLGTTTLAACAVLGTKILTSVSAPNPQCRIGSDVLSRIQFSMESAAHRLELQELLLNAVCGLAWKLLLSPEVRAQSVPVRRIVFAGNTTMEESLIGLDLTSLAALPFQPSESLGTNFLAGDPIWNGGLALFAPETPVRLLPVMGGFVGGDVTAGILAVRSSVPPEKESLPTFFLDLGTNGEMVLETESFRIACATAAGPCFEGAGISCGMCAESGAVTHVENRDGQPFFETLHASPIRGVCGSALIDLTAELLRLGLLTPDGRLLEPGEVPADVPAGWKACLTHVETRSVPTLPMPAFRIADSIFVTQEDFRELQLAVGAIRTGIRLLLRRAGLTASGLAHFRVAGGFGRSVRAANAQLIGLIPSDLAPNAFEFVGNASLAGAVLTAVSDSRWAQTQHLVREIECLDLAQEEGFADVFMESMIWETFCE